MKQKPLHKERWTGPSKNINPATGPVFAHLLEEEQEEHCQKQTPDADMRAQCPLLGPVLAAQHHAAGLAFNGCGQLVVSYSVMSDSFLTLLISRINLHHCSVVLSSRANSLEFNNIFSDKITHIFVEIL